MPVWVSELGQLLLEIAAFLFGCGFLTIVWKVAWAMRGWVDAEKVRAHTNEELVKLVRDFISMQSEANAEQRRMNDQFATGMRTLGRRLRSVEEEKLEQS